MSECSRPQCVKITVYILTACQFVIGLIHILQGIAHQSETFLVVIGLIEIGLGLLLVYGIAKNNETCVMIYLVLGVVGVLILTVRVLLVVIRAGQEVSDEVIGVLVVALLLAWSLQYSIYLFYRDMVANNRAAAVVAGSVNITCNEPVVYSNVNHFDEFSAAPKEVSAESTAV